MKALLILFLVSFIFSAVSYSQEEILCGAVSTEPVEIVQTIGTENLVIVLVDYPNGRVQPGNIPPAQDSDTTLVASIDAVGGLGYIYKNPVNPSEGKKKKVCKYTYDDYWDWVFSDSPVWTGQRHPDSDIEPVEVETYGSLKDYYKEVSYNNLIITPAQTRSGSGKYNTGIINAYDEINGKKYIRWIMLPENKSYYYQDNPDPNKRYGPLEQVIPEIRSQAPWFDVDTYLANGGKILIISAGFHRRSVAQLSGQLLSVIEKRYSNNYNNSTLHGIAIMAHEYGHTLGFKHLASGTLDPMNLTYQESWTDFFFSPPHFNPIYKFQKGWLTASDAIKISSTGNISLPPITSSSKKAGVVTIYGDALRNGDWNHSEYFVLEYRKRENFNRYAGGVNADFGNDNGGVLIWHQSKYKPYQLSGVDYTMDNQHENTVGVRVANYLSPDNYAWFYGYANMSHFFYSGHNSITPGTNPSTNSGVYLTTGISMSNFSVSNGNMGITINYTNAVPAYSYFFYPGSSFSGSVSGNIYIEDVFSSNLTVTSPGNINFAPGSLFNPGYVIANSSTQNGIVFQGAGFGTSRVPWQGIWLSNNSAQGSSITNCLIKDVTDEYSKAGIYIPISDNGISPIVSDNEFQNCTTDLWFYNYGTSHKNINASNNTFSGNGKIKVMGKWSLANTFTVPLGAELVITHVLNYEFGELPTEIKFDSGVNLYCYGKLSASGISSNYLTFTRAGTSGTWGSIVFNGSGAAGSSFNYVNMSYGTNVQAINTSDIVVQNSGFTGNSGGISFTNSTGTVFKNIINGGTTGINVQNGSTVTCNENKIKNSGTGISYTGASYGYIGGNDIAYCATGIYTSGSNPLFKNTPGSYSKNNRITNTSWCALSMNNSHPVLYDGTNCNGRNSIHSNDEYDMIYINCGGHNLDAIGIYWDGGDPANAIIQGCDGATIYTTPYHTIDPWEGEPLPSIQRIETENEKITVFSSSLQNTASLQSGSTRSFAGFKGINSDNSVSKDPLLTGIQLREDGQFIEAKNFFLTYLINNPGDQRASLELYNCFNEKTSSEIIKYFESLSYFSAEQKLLLGYLYQKQGDIKSAKEINNSVRAQNFQTLSGVKADINNFYITLYNENNTQTAGIILNNIKNKREIIPGLATRENDFEISLAQFALDTYVPSENSQNGGLAKESINDISNTTPKEYKLEQNYPNPFNPTTTISYTLPQAGKVVLKVYDVLGSEIAALIDEVKETGYHTVIFNGSNLASGLYFARITINSQNQQPFVKTIKMMLTK
jgi:M6 family metalloprotease-like protein